MHPDLQISHQHVTTGPSGNGLARKDFLDPPGKGGPARQSQPDQHQAVVSARSKLPQIAEVQILSDEEPTGSLSRLPNVRVPAARKTLGADGIHIVPQRNQFLDERLRQILVPFESHATTGSGVKGRSTSAEAAA